MPAGERRPFSAATHPGGPSLRGASDLVCLLTVLVAVVSASLHPGDSDAGPNSAGTTSGGAAEISRAGPPESPPPVTACPRCLTLADRQEATKLKVEAIKRQILSKLSLQAKPNITVPLAPKEVVLEVLKKSGGLPRDVESQGHFDHFHSTSDAYPNDERFREDRDDYYAKTSEIVAFAEPGASINGHNLIDLRHPHDNPRRLQVMEAKLWIHLRPDGNAPNNESHSVIYLFRATRKSKRGGHGGDSSLPSTASYNTSSILDFDLELLHSLSFNASTVGWKSFNMIKVVQKWFAESPQNKLTLLIDCNLGCVGVVSLFGGGRHHHNYPSDADFGGGGDPSRRHRHKNLRPFLVIATQPAPRRRSRRHVITCNENTSGCCKQSLYVSFKELHWDDWIIAPKGYYANYCVGECVTRTPDTLAHFHTHVIEEYRSRNPYASIVPCCAPTRLSSMSLIYYDNNSNIIKTDLPKMIVEECGCT